MSTLAIYKYALPLDGGFVSMPKGANIKHAGSQHGCFFVWAIVDTEEKQMDRRQFLILGTGHHFDGSDLVHMRHVATFQDGMFVWHVFEWV